MNGEEEELEDSWRRRTLALGATLEDFCKKKAIGARDPTSIAFMEESKPKEERGEK